ncbi:MAG: HEAT repeat domain-containing protein [Anaerolineae bacterium]|nr:HEAT repeat domain-containing protein [Anaerolineae bacterium]
MPLFGSNTPLDITQLAAQRDVKMLIKALLYQKGMKERFLRKTEEDVRREAAKALGEIGDARAIQPLISVLNHSDWHVRDAAVEALGKIGDARAINPLLAALNDSQVYVRNSASEALKRMEPKLDDQQRVQAAIAQAGIVPERWKEVVGFGSIAVKPLIASLNDGAINVRQKVIEALGQIGDVQAVQPLIKALNDSHSDIRYFAAQALGQIGDVRAFNPLIAALNDSDSSVRSSAAQALKPMQQRLDEQQRIQVAIAGEAWEEVVGFGSAAVQPLIAALNEGDTSSAAKALAEIGDARAVEPLIAKLGDTRLDGIRHGDWLVGERVSKSLQTMKLDPDWLTSELGSQAIGKLITALTEAGIAWQKAGRDYFDEWQHPVTPTTDAWRIVKGIAAVIPNFGARAIESVATLLNDSNWVVRMVAAVTLARVGDTRAIEPLIAILEDSDEKARERVFEALGSLQEQLNDQQRAQFAIARKAWREVVGFGSAAVEPLIAALLNKDYTPSAAEALGQIGDVRAVEPLISVLNHSDWTVRDAAAEALGQIGDARAVEPLIAALLNKDYTPSAAKALAQIGDVRAVEPLIAKLGDTHLNGVKKGVPLVGEAVSTSLQTMKLDPDWLTSEQGSQAIGKLIAALTEAGIAGQKQERDFSDMGLPLVTPWRIVKGIAAVIPNFGPRAIESVAALLNDSNWVVRLVAAVTLAQVGDTRAVEPLMAILEDSDEKARKRVVEALEPLQEQLTDQQRAQLAIARKA